MVKNRISIILPIYNVQPYLARCVESLLCQTYSDLEILLVDDGSTDGGSQLCDALAQTDARIVVIHKPNSGVADARNAGLEAATGEFISFVDPDDYITPHMMEKLLSALRENDADLSVCNFLCVGDMSEGFRRFNESLPFKDEVLIGREQIRQAVFESQEWHWVVLWNKLYRRQLFDAARFQTGKICEDEFILHEIILPCNRIVCLSEPLYFYERRDGSITHSTFKVQRLDGAEALLRRAGDLMQNGCSHSSVYMAAISGINHLKRIFDAGMQNDPACRARYAQLLAQFRRLGLFRLLKHADGLGHKAVVLLAYISPKLMWALRGSMKRE
ncbi:MAG: glycosyltransferase [Oscillospiraceae bacterium]|nr:glycosyltransferase [Oscillospiraceae bacterium]